MVGGMSALNAIAGAYSADLPLLIVSGAPNSHDEECRHIVHHTNGEKDIYQSAKCMEPVVCKALAVRHRCDVQGTFFISCAMSRFNVLN